MLKFREYIFQQLFAVVCFIATLNLVIESEGLFLQGGLVAVDKPNSFVYMLFMLMFLVSILLFINIYKNRYYKAALFAVYYFCYIFFVKHGEPFMSFQWDALLLETCFLSFLYYLLTPKYQLGEIAVWFFRILVFKLMLMSGIAKLASGDKTWLDCTAMNFHYFTQPLPTWSSFFVHNLPEIFHKISCFLMFVIELVLPFFIFTTRPLREFAAWAFIALQVIIFLTGNYGFFNILTAILCISLFDFKSFTDKEDTALKINRFILLGILGLYAFVSLSLIPMRSSLPIAFKKPGAFYLHNFGQHYLSSPYGLFAVMTKKRGEIVLQGLNEKNEWLPYEFHHKPQDLKRLPNQVAPFQPRVDWQMWFAALGNYKRNPWLIKLCQELLFGNKKMHAFFKDNPFKDKPPLAIRALYFDYKFNDFDTYFRTKEFWRREYVGQYLPAIYLRK